MKKITTCQTEYRSVRTTNIKIKPLSLATKIPTYGTQLAAGADLCAVLKEPVTITPNETKLIPTGISLAIPNGLVGLIYARSGLSTKQDLAPANKVGVIDADYRGEVMVPLHNHGVQSRVVQNGDRIAQIVFMPYVQANFEVVDELSTTDRGAGAFGHTGK